MRAFRLLGLLVALLLASCGADMLAPTPPAPTIAPGTPTPVPSSTPRPTFIPTEAPAAPTDLAPTPTLTLAAPTDPAPSPPALSFRVLVDGETLRGDFLRASPAPALHVIQNQARIAPVLEQLAGSPPQFSTYPSPLTPLDELDYDRQVAILVLQGVHGSSGYDVQVDRVVLENRRLRVLATFEEPRPDQIVNQGVTDPYVLLAVDKTWGAAAPVEVQLVVKGAVVASAPYP
jgi:hypothetical protein